MAPSFNSNMLRRYFDIFVEHSLIFTDELEKVGANGKEIIFLEYIEQCALNIAYGKTKYYYLFVTNIWISYKLL